MIAGRAGTADQQPAAERELTDVEAHGLAALGVIAHWDGAIAAAHGGIGVREFAARRVAAIDAFITAEQPQPDPLADTISYLQGRRRDCLRALRASTDAGADYWRWQGHAELSRQLLERLGAEVPQ